MSKVNAKQLLQHAKENKYAVGYFESWNLESTLAVIRAAEKLKSPVMIGVCGTYVGEPKRKYPESIDVYAAMLKKIAEEASVPVVTLLNESDDETMVYQAIKAGFDMVMFAPIFASDALPFEEQVRIQKNIVRYASACGVAVEAEVGELPLNNSATGEFHEGENTDPEVAARFAEEVGIDALAVAVGNCHLMEDGKASLDLNLLKTISEKTKAHLVLHGGTGVDLADFKKAIDLGIVKVNVGTALKRAVINATKDYFAGHDVDHMDPNDVLGRGCEMDLAVVQEAAIMNVVESYIKAFNGENKAF